MLAELSINEKSSKHILIAGVGQLGTRHLQALTYSKQSLAIFLYDVDLGAINRALARLYEVNWDHKKHRIYFLRCLAEGPANFDMAIVSTNADVRLSIIDELFATCDVKNLLLEKVLAQSVDDLQRISDACRGSDNVFVNLPRPQMSAYKTLKSSLSNVNPSNITVEGVNWNMASNAVHYAHLINWLFGGELISVNTDLLSSGWFECKRKGFFEVTGTLQLVFSPNTCVRLTSLDAGAVSDEINLHIDTNQGAFQICEGKNIVISGLERDLVGKFELQSQLTGETVDNLLLNGDCDLPQLSSVVNAQALIISALKSHWESCEGYISERLPIT